MGYSVYLHRLQIVKRLSWICQCGCSEKLIAGSTHSYSIHVSQAHVPACALVFHNLLNISDPASVKSLTGPCPAYSEYVAGTWVYVSCKIDFGGEYREGSSIILYIRKYDGFINT